MIIQVVVLENVFLLLFGEMIQFDQFFFVKRVAEPPTTSIYRHRYLVCKCWYYTFRILCQGVPMFSLRKMNFARLKFFLGEALQFMEEFDGNKNPNILTCKTHKVC